MQNYGISVINPTTAPHKGFSPFPFQTSSRIPCILFCKDIKKMAIFAGAIVVLLPTGRPPYTSGLNPKAAGVDTDERGLWVTHEEYSRL